VTEARALLDACVLAESGGALPAQTLWNPWVKLDSNAQSQANAAPPAAPITKCRQSRPRNGSSGI